MYLEYMGSSYFITLNEQKDQNDVSRILIFWVEILLCLFQEIKTKLWRKISAKCHRRICSEVPLLHSTRKAHRPLMLFRRGPLSIDSPS